MRRDARLRALADASESENVVPFVRVQQEASREAAPPVRLKSFDRPAPRLANPGDNPAWLVALLLCSLLLHGGLLALFRDEPEPHSSIGIPAISVEIVLGADVPAGVAQTPSPNETQEITPTEERQEPVEPDADVGEPKKTESPEQAAETDPETVAQPVANAESQVKAEAVPPQAEPERAEAAEPIPAPPPVQPEQERKPKEESKQAPALKPKQDVKELRRGESKAKQPPRPRIAPAASGVGRGRSSADANYHGLVAAHLNRHKQVPAHAPRGGKVTASITFTIGGGGRVTSVRLARTSGVAALDRESIAMVRRASPFPAPPRGRPMSFTVPVSFDVR